MFDAEREIAKKTTILEAIPEDRFLCGFGHIFAGGYSAGYYSYLWAEVLSADAFGAFEEAGLEDDAAVIETGAKFASTVLAMGGGSRPSRSSPSSGVGSPAWRPCSGTTDSSPPRRKREEGETWRRKAEEDPVMVTFEGVTNFCPSHFCNAYFND